MSISLCIFVADSNRTAAESCREQISQHDHNHHGLKSWTNVPRCPHTHSSSLTCRKLDSNERYDCDFEHAKSGLRDYFGGLRIEPKVSMFSEIVNFVDAQDASWDLQEIQQASETCSIIHSDFSINRISQDTESFSQDVVVQFDLYADRNSSPFSFSNVVTSVNSNYLSLYRLPALTE
ncbi:hypothetical protein AN958_09001 [Leucoagaricus sp. SymC.cos]|nr:hypothetical protein AN958_09001 [Leucoagaricus sp. SymC.cos]